MSDYLTGSLKIASSGLQAESIRMRVVSENLANAQSTAEVPGTDPYQRKLVSFETVADRVSGSMSVGVARVGRDNSDFRIENIPGHPAADPNGNVLLPNVNPIIEMADMREANHAYRANLEVFTQARELISMTIDLMRTRR
ncbi:MAG: flagellar basal body rod protein FlgC [Pseudomonadota bacterium]